MDFDKKFLVVGTGISGTGVIDFLRGNGAAFEIWNKKTVLRGFDYAIVSAGFSMRSPIVKRLKRKGIEIVGELALTQLKGTTVAVTGTNGKTTVVLLIEHILKIAGKKATASGNVGKSVLMSESCDDGINVIEVSSYMMEKSPAFSPDIAVLTNLAPDHIKHHKNIKNYYKTKIVMLYNALKGGFAVINADCSKSMLETKELNTRKIFFSIKNESNGAYVQDGAFFSAQTRLCGVDEIKLFGEHNHSNVCAAICVCRILGVKILQIVEGLKSFEGVRHRLQTIKKENGKTYINDSKATNINSMLCALKAVADEKVLILGGSTKGENFRRIFAENRFGIVSVVCYGAEGTKIFRHIKKHFSSGEVFYIKNFRSAVIFAMQLTKAGQTCLLSPACASFDQHKNFEERGDEFISTILNEDIGVDA